MGTDGAGQRKGKDRSQRGADIRHEAQQEADGSPKQRGRHADHEQADADDKAKRRVDP